MPIDTLSIENFKGIKNKQEFSIRPLTIFCGPNSSGKSTCIHALAALAQTTKLTASHVPIVLDDEYAQVHLGRFLDVIHSKSLKESFSIGLEPPRDSRRLHILRGWSDEQINEVFAGGSGAGCSAGV